MEKRPLKSTEVWSFDFGLRVGITAKKFKRSSTENAVGLRKIHCGPILF